MYPRLASAVVLLLLAAAPAVFAQQTAPPPGAVVEQDVAVPMRDGVVLRADVWRPAARGRFPVLVYRTPYDKREAVQDYTTFRRAVERGYAVVIQDVRGRYASGGEFRPYENEGRDGYDTIEWTAAQPWSNGAVGTFGLSYPGAVQWLAAMESPPHLKAMVPAMTFASPRMFFYSAGLWDMSWPYWIWNNISPDIRRRKDLPGPRSYDEARQQWPQLKDTMLNTLPLLEMDLLRDTAPFYYDWLRHPPEDEFWDFAELRGKYERVTAAVLNLSGWHDEAYGPDGAVANFLGLMRTRRRWADPRTALLLGPWTHGVDATSRTRSGAREFGPAAAIDYDQLVLDWMDRYVRDLPPAEEPPRVRFFVMGQNRWRADSKWPPSDSDDKAFYLSTLGGSSTLERSAPDVMNSFSEFVSDPADPVTDPHADEYGAHDYRVMAERGDVLIFDSAPLEADTEVSGRITAEIHLSVDAPDTDLFVRLLDVAPDGAAYNLASPGLEALRASYREGGRRKLLTPGRVYRLTLSNLVTSNMFRKGHRIRVQISASFHPHFSRNLHTGEREAASAAMRKARLRVYHDRGRASRILLPVVDR